MNPAATRFLAFYGAVVSTLAIALNVYRELRDRARLELSVIVGYKVNHGATIVSRALMLQQRPAMVADASPSLFLTIHNAGRHPVLVQGWAIRADKKAAGHENFVYKLTVLPKLLKEG